MGHVSGLRVSGARARISRSGKGRSEGRSRMAGQEINRAPLACVDGGGAERAGGVAVQHPWATLREIEQPVNAWLAGRDGWRRIWCCGVRGRMSGPCRQGSGWFARSVGPGWKRGEEDAAADHQPQPGGPPGPQLRRLSNLWRRASPPWMRNWLRHEVARLTVGTMKGEPNPVCCHWSPTATCDGGNPVVGRSRNNVALARKGQDKAARQSRAEGVPIYLPLCTM